MNLILEMLQDIRPDSDFAQSTNFVTDYLLDSFDIIALTSELEDKFNIHIKTSDVIPENYQSIAAISALVQKCGGVI